MADSYEVRRADRAVTAWSTRRLFEPTGPMVELRAELRAALAAMSPAHGRLLHAVYASTDRSHCDLENVVVYNVGARPFTRIARDGLALERRFDVRALTFQPDSAPPDAHWLQYDVGSPEMPAAWRDAGTVASWDQPGWPRLSSSARAATVWYRLSGGDIDTVSNPGTSEHLGIELDVTRPLTIEVNPASIIKPLIDGILAALCHHDGTRLDIVAERLVDQLPADAGGHPPPADLARTTVCSAPARSYGPTALASSGIRPTIDSSPSCSACTTTSHRTGVSPVACSWSPLLWTNLRPIVPREPIRKVREELDT